MLVNRSSLSRFAVPQTSAEWEQILARYMTHIAKVPVSTWQFLVRVVLVFCLALSFGRLFWLVFPVPVIPAGSVAVATSNAPVDSNSGSVNISQIKSLPVFGKVEAPKPQEQQQQAAVIETKVVNSQLNLTLVGVVASNEEASSRAIIGSGDKQDVYAINDTLPVGANVTLAKVMPDRVIVNNNGQFESVWLYQADLNAPPISQASMAPVVEQQQPIYPTGRPGFGGPEMQSPRDNGGPSVAEVSRNLSDVLAMSIYRENGRVVGYKIRPGRDAERFKSFGLQNDDVVTAINGTPLTDPAKIMEVYKNMGNTTSASLEIKRGGSVITVDVVLQ